MKLSILLFSLFYWVAVPDLSYAGDGHKHASGEKHTESEKGDDHSGHAHGKSKKKTKKKKDHKGHDHSEEDDHHDDHSGHAHGKSKKKTKKKKDHRGHDHPEEDDHSEEDGHKHDKSSNNEEGGAHGEDHGHAHANEEGHGEDEHGHSEGEEHAEEEQHAHSEESGHDGHNDHDEHGVSGIGPGKAIVEVANEGNRFKLSKESEEFLKIETTNIESLGDGQYKIPKSTIVTYQNSKGIYIKFDGWFEIRNIKVLSTKNGHSIVSGSGIGTSTLVASTGLGFLRAAHLQATGQGGKGHAH